MKCHLECDVGYYTKNFGLPDHEVNSLLAQANICVCQAEDTNTILSILLYVQEVVPRLI